MISNYNLEEYFEYSSYTARAGLFVARNFQVLEFDLLFGLKSDFAYELGENKFANSKGKDMSGIPILNRGSYAISFYGKIFF